MNYIDWDTAEDSEHFTLILLFLIVLLLSGQVSACSFSEGYFCVILFYFRGFCKMHLV